MAADFPWDEAGRFDDLQQGDLFSNCPVIRTDPALYLQYLNAVGGVMPSSMQTSVVAAKIIVLTQSCDLVKPDFPQVLVCAYRPATEYSRNQRIEIAKDRHVSLHMIDAFANGPLGFPQQVIDFRLVYTLPREFLLELSARRGERVRLLPPYREHLAQAFARFFMRVGLPRNIAVE